MDRQDPWLEFLDRLLVTANMGDVAFASGSASAEADPEAEASGETAMSGNAASRRAASRLAAAGQPMARPGSPRG